MINYLRKENNFIFSKNVLEFLFYFIQNYNLLKYKVSTGGLKLKNFKPQAVISVFENF